MRRAIEPELGKWALPGGYVNEGETAEMAATRELMEETGLDVSPLEWILQGTEISPSNRLLVFLSTPSKNRIWFEQNSAKSEESLACESLCSGGDEAAFDLHEKQARKFMDKINKPWAVAYTSGMKHERRKNFLNVCQKSGFISNSVAEHLAKFE